MNHNEANSRVATLNEQEILGSEDFLTHLRAVAARQQRSQSDVEKYARECLQELAVRPSDRYLDWVAKLARFMYSRSYEPVLDVNVEQLERLKQLSETRPMVFLWSHKSHMDSFVFMRAMYDHDFRPQPLSFAGINMNFAGFGAVAKRAGAIFLRRSFTDDEIYKLVFKHYIDYLVSKRLPLSWSIEGTRSRTGKLMPPKLGLIQWVVQSYQRSACDDALLVPVSISYDQIAEIGDYVSMQRGLPKRKESLRWFVGYLSGMRTPYGKIYLRFAEPVALSASVQISDQMFDQNADANRVQVNKLAFEVCSRIEHTTPITAVDLVTLVLLAANGRALTREEVDAHANDILLLIRRRDLPMAGTLTTNSELRLSNTLEAMTRTGLLHCYEQGAAPVYRITPGKHLAAAYYRNTIIHYFLSNALAELALASLPPTGASEAHFWDSVIRLRDLLKFEFFFKAKSAFKQDVADALEFRSPNWTAVLQQDSSPAATLFSEARPLFGHSILRSFVEAYQVVAQALLASAGRTIADQKAFLSTCLHLGEEMLLRKQLSSEAALSQSLFATALRLAEYRGLLAGDAEELNRKRGEFSAEIKRAADAVNLLQSYYDGSAGVGGQK